MDYVPLVGAAMRSILERHHVPFVDLTTCLPLSCKNEDFIDGFHGGSVFYAKILLELARHAPWLEDVIDRAAIEARLAQASNSWELAPR